MTIGELWDTDLVGDGLLDASERGAWAMGVLKKVQISRGG